MAFILFSGLILPWACNENRTATTPGTVNTPTPSASALSPTPTFVGNYGTSAAPNGMYYDIASSTLYVATGEIRTGGDITMFEKFAVVGGTLIGGTDDNHYIYGFPTPEPPPPTPTIPPWTGTTIVATLPQAFALSAGPVWGMLDSSPTGAATFWEGCNGFDIGLVPPSQSEYPTHTDAGFGGVSLASPRAAVGDTFGNFYVTDTGHGYIDEFAAVCSSGPSPNPSWEHRWNGSASSFLFKRPVALACDVGSANVTVRNSVFVGDAGYTPSVVEQYTSGGTTLLGAWQLQPGCIINGMAFDNLGNVFVSDIGTGQIEDYQINPYPTTPTSTLTLVRAWGDPHGSHEFLPFLPSCIALIQTTATTAPSFIIVGDTNNDMLQVFGP